MERNEILKQMNAVFIDTLENESIILSENTKATDIDEWDSLTHILLVVAMENNFNIRFTSSEIQEWNNVGQIIDSILSK
jgi:acyl carrier protein